MFWGFDEELMVQMRCVSFICITLEQKKIRNGVIHLFYVCCKKRYQLTCMQSSSIRRESKRLLLFIYERRTATQCIPENMLIAIDTFASPPASIEYTHVHLWFVVREREQLPYNNCNNNNNKYRFVEYKRKKKKTKHVNENAQMCVCMNVGRWGWQNKCFAFMQWNGVFYHILCALDWERHDHLATNYRIHIDWNDTTHGDRLLFLNGKQSTWERIECKWKIKTNKFVTMCCHCQCKWVWWHLAWSG